MLILIELVTVVYSLCDVAMGPRLVRLLFLQVLAFFVIISFSGSLILLCCGPGLPRVAFPCGPPPKDDFYSFPGCSFRDLRLMEQPGLEFLEVSA